MAGLSRFRFERSTLLFAVLFIAFGAFLFALFQKQILEHSEYAESAKAQSTSITATPAQRGQILARDRDGKYYALAVSEWQYSLSITPRSVKDKRKLLDLLKVDLPELNVDEVLAKIDNTKVYVPPVIKGIKGDVARKISEKNYAGVVLLPSLIRVYPDGSKIAPQALGFVGADGEGKYGVEAIHDAVLRGRAGANTAKKDSLGRLISILGSDRPEDGSDLLLTLDYNLQFTVENQLQKALEEYQADAGSVVVMDAKNGGVLAVASQPNFDPNAYSQVPGSEQGRFLLSAASHVYEPGSVVKPVTMAMALDQKLVTPETEHNAGGAVQVLGYEIRNAEDKVYGNQNMSQVLENSDNVQMVWISSLLGSEVERGYFEKLGWGEKTGLDVVGEQGGRLPPKEEWNDLLRSTAAFGQGISATAVRLAAIYCALVNGGQTVTPHLVAATSSGGKETAIALPAQTTVFSTETSAQIREMMVNVVEKGHGKRARVEGVKVGGKTGTAEVPDPSGGYYADRHIGTFAGFFPADDPQYVMVVRLDNPKTVKFAESSAAPTFGAIANWMTNYFQLRK